MNTLAKCAMIGIAFAAVGAGGLRLLFARSKEPPGQSTGMESTTPQSVADVRLQLVDGMLTSTTPHIMESESSNAWLKLVHGVLSQDTGVEATTPQSAQPEAVDVRLELDDEMPTQSDGMKSTTSQSMESEAADAGLKLVDGMLSQSTGLGSATSQSMKSESADATLKLIDGIVPRLQLVDGMPTSTSPHIMESEASNAWLKLVHGVLSQDTGMETTTPQSAQPEAVDVRLELDDEMPTQSDGMKSTTSQSMESEAADAGLKLVDGMLSQSTGLGSATSQSMKSESVDPRLKLIDGIVPRHAWSAECKAADGSLSPISAQWYVPERPNPFPMPPCKEGFPPRSEYCEGGRDASDPSKPQVCCRDGRDPATPPDAAALLEGPKLGDEPVFGGMVGQWGPDLGIAGKVQKTLTYGDGRTLHFLVRCPHAHDHSRGSVTIWEDGEGMDESNGLTFDFPDYKGRPIRVPDQNMVNWWRARLIDHWSIQRKKEDPAEQKYGRAQRPVSQSTALTVVFGTKSDGYAQYAEKHGTMSRRAAHDLLQDSKRRYYDEKLDVLNPLRVESKFLLGPHGVLKAKGTATNNWGVTKTAEEVKQRWEEIYEVSRQRIKATGLGQDGAGHTTHFIMLNQFLKSSWDFVHMYMAGSQGKNGIQYPSVLHVSTDGWLDGGLEHSPPTECTTGHCDAPVVAQIQHVTDHELFSIFAGKYRKGILDNALFGDDDTSIEDVDKVKNTWYTKNQFSRMLRILNQ